MRSRMDLKTSPFPECPVKHSVVLEAELIAFDETKGIDGEFLLIEAMLNVLG